MAKPAVADDVEHDILVELLAELGGDARGMHDGLGIIAVDVEDGGLDHQRDIRGIRRGAREMRCCGKADLVVHHDMHRAAGPVPLEPG